MTKDKKEYTENDSQTEDEIVTETKEDPVDNDTQEEEQNEKPEVNKLEEDYLKLKDDYVRLYAEMDNMKKRAHSETEKTIKFAVSTFAKELLTVADNLDRAISAMNDNKDSCKELLQGVELTQNELTKVFEKFGIKRFNHIGEKFDPNFERVVQEVPNPDAEPGTILSELQTGYTIHDRILREAMVIVAK